MARAVYELDDEAVELVVSTYCEKYGYQPLVGEEPNPESRIEFARRIVFNAIRQEVADWKVSKASAELAASIRAQLQDIRVEVQTEVTE